MRKRVTKIRRAPRPRKVEPPRNSAGQDQLVLYADNSFFPDELPSERDLKPAKNLAALFDECHNNVYANEGLLKDKIFHEMVKLLAMKLHDEEHHSQTGLQFGITASEYERVVAHKRSSFELRLGKLLRLVRERRLDLIVDDTLKLKPLTLAFIVGRLQHVSLLRTAGDVKGEAYQSFVSRHQRGDRGEFFTPFPVVKLAVEMLAPREYENVCDPACGTAGFLVETVSFLASRHPDFNKAKYVRDRLRGIDFNPDVALSAALRLAFEGGNGAEVSCANALSESEQLDGTFDLVLTNPPFGSKGKVEDQRVLGRYTLARRWTDAGGGGWKPSNQVLSGQSPEILFIERALRLLKPGGRMAIVLPDGLLQNISNGHIRFWICSQAKVLAVVSIPQEAFVPYGTGIKTSLVLLQKLPAVADEVFMSRIHSIGYDVKGHPIYRRDDRGTLVRSRSGEAVLDDDTEAISRAFTDFRTGKFSEDDCSFIVKETSLNSRIDVEHYLPYDEQLVQLLTAQDSRPLGSLVQILTESADFRSVGGSTIRYIAIGDVDFRSFQVVSPQVIKAHDAPSRATYRVQAGDIITAVSGANTGTFKQATALISEEEEGAICSNGFAVLRGFRDIEPFFLLAYMRTEFYLRQVRRLMTGHAIPCISTDDLAKVLVPIPAVEDQQLVAVSMAEIVEARREAMRRGDTVVSGVNDLIWRSTVASDEAGK